MTDDTPETPTEDAPQDFAAFEAAQNEPGEKRGDDDTPEVNDDADAPPADEDETDEQKEKKRSRSPERRIAEERWKRGEAERRAVAAERELIDLRSRAGVQPATTELKAPHPDDKNDDGTDKYEFGEADPRFGKDTARYEARLVIAEERQAMREEGERATVQAQLQDGMANIEAKGTEKYTDFEEKITAAVEARGGEPLHPVVSVGLAVSPVGADVAYKLATDTAAADRLEHLASTDMQAAAMAFGELEGEFTDNDDDLKIKDPLDMARMLGRMRARQGKPAAAVTPIKTTNAPEPPKERARGGSGTFQADAATTDFAAFERMANRK